MLDSAESSLESVSMLAQTVPLCGMQVIPASLSVLVLLQAVDSPFINTEKTATLRDIVEALFIIKYRDKVGSYLLGQARRREYLMRLEHEARKKQKIYPILIDAIGKRESPEYDRLLLEFGETVGVLNVTLSIMEIVTYIRQSSGRALGMLKGGSSGDSKKN